MEHLTPARAVLCSPSVCPSGMTQPCEHTTCWGESRHKGSLHCIYQQKASWEAGKDVLEMDNRVQNRIRLKQESNDQRGIERRSQLYLGRMTMFRQKFPSSCPVKAPNISKCHLIGSCCLGSHRSVCSPVILGTVWMFRIVWLISFLDWLGWVSCFQLGSEQKERMRLCWKHGSKICTTMILLEWKTDLPKPKDKMCASVCNLGCDVKQEKQKWLTFAWRGDKKVM